MSAPEIFEAVRRGEAARLLRLLAEEPEGVAARLDAAVAPDGAAGWTPLHLAAYHGRAEVERALAEAGADLAARHAGGRTALHVALEFDNATRDLLIELGVPVDASAAAALGDTTRLEELLAEEPGLVDDASTGLEPLAWAAYFGQLDAARLLLDRGARLDGQALHCAAQVDGAEIARLLLARGADPNLWLDGWGATPLHAAAAMRYATDSTRVIRVLLDAGADPARRSARGATPREIAERLAHERAARGAAESEERAYGEVAALLAEAELRRPESP